MRARMLARPARITPRLATRVALLLTVALLLVLAWDKRWVGDDAYIYLRVVSNLQDGLGPVWNAGERVEVFTSPLWVAMLWLLSSALWFVELEWISVWL